VVRRLRLIIVGPGSIAGCYHTGIQYMKLTTETCRCWRKTTGPHVDEELVPCFLYLLPSRPRNPTNDKASYTLATEALFTLGLAEASGELLDLVFHELVIRAAECKRRLRCYSPGIWLTNFVSDYSCRWRP
jgi:hypothetical protein